MKTIERNLGKRVINDRFILNRKIDSGSQGIVYAGYDKLHKEHVICKIQKNDRIFKTEVEVLQKINEQSLLNFPTIKHLEKMTGDKTCIIMDRYHSSLHDILKKSGQQPTPQSVWQIAI